jgi:hypothetical protein
MKARSAIRVAGAIAVVALLAASGHGFAASAYVRSASSVTLSKLGEKPTTVVSATLPPGSWIVSANLNAIAADPAGNYLDCRLSTPLSTVAQQFMSVYYSNNSNGGSPFFEYRIMSLQGGLTNRASATVSLTCYIEYTSVNAYKVTNVTLIATPVSGIQ